MHLACLGQNIKLQSNIERILSSNEFKHSNITLSILDIDDGTLDAAIRPYNVAIPASSQKLLTTLTALDVIGEEFQYETTIAYKGAILEDGTLKGDIHIIGSGDPTLGSGKFSGFPTYEEAIDAIALIIKDAGITCIDGAIIADESIYNSYPVAPTWQWNDLGNYYASGAWGININENKYTIYFDNRGVVGRRPKIKSHYPNIPDLEFSNEVAVDSAGTGDNAYIFGGPYNFSKRIIGTIPAGAGTFSIKGSIPDPPKFLAQMVGKKLEKYGIQSVETKVQFTPLRSTIDKEEIGKLYSPPLKDIVKQANLESNNLYCESMLKTLGHVVRKNGSGQLGISAIKRYLKKLKVEHTCLTMQDGSGLSARNNVCSYMLADFLRKYTIKNNFNYVLNFLPQGGVSGTIAGHFKQSEAAGKIWAKSGTMSSVISYTGLVKCKSGRRKSFCIIVNGFDAKQKTIRAKLEKVMKEIYFQG